VFVPPWNRCTDVTVALLAELGFAGLSRDASRPRRHHRGLGEVGVRVDWARVWREGGPRLLGQALASAVTVAVRPGRGAVGVMLHHANLGTDGLRAVQDLLAVVHEHPAVTVSRLADLVRQPCLAGPNATADAGTEPPGGCHE
jgi:hypothetical protein